MSNLRRIWSGGQHHLYLVWAGITGTPLILSDRVKVLTFPERDTIMYDFGEYVLVMELDQCRIFRRDSKPEEQG